MTQKEKPKNRSNKLHQNFLVEKAKKLNKDWMGGKSGGRKYFGYLNKNSMSIILLAILFLVMLGDVILINNYLYK